MPHVVRKADQVAAALEQVREERNAIGRLRVEDLEKLRDLDDGGSGDDTDTETFADGKLEAVGGSEGVDVHNESLVAHGADEAAAGFDKRRREIVCYWLEKRTNRLHYGGLEKVPSDGGVEKMLWVCCPEADGTA